MCRSTSARVRWLSTARRTTSPSRTTSRRCLVHVARDRLDGEPAPRTQPAKASALFVPRARSGKTWRPVAMLVGVTVDEDEEGRGLVGERYRTSDGRSWLPMPPQPIRTIRLGIAPPPSGRPGGRHEIGAEPVARACSARAAAASSESSSRRRSGDGPTASDLAGQQRERRRLRPRLAPRRRRQLHSLPATRRAARRALGVARGPRSGGRRSGDRRRRSPPTRMAVAGVDRRRRRGARRTPPRRLRRSNSPRHRRRRGSGSTRRHETQLASSASSSVWLTETGLPSGAGTNRSKPSSPHRRRTSASVRWRR